jgi:hypothetical protein
MAATYRSIQTGFWTDAWVVQLTPEQKYFYIYLLTNQRVSQCGIYEISLKQMEFETGYNKDTIEKLLTIFEKKKKIMFSIETSEICITNFSKYNYSSSPKVRIHILKELDKVKDKSLIQYLYGIDTIYKEYAYPIDAESQEKEKEKEEKKEPSLSLDKEILFEIFLMDKNYPVEEYHRFINNYERTGWVDKNGNVIKDPYAAARNWTQLSTPIKYFIRPEYHKVWQKVWSNYKKLVGFDKAKYLLKVKPQIKTDEIIFICDQDTIELCESNIDGLKPILRTFFGSSVKLNYSVPSYIKEPVPIG